MLAVVGPSGVGKSTLGNVLLGLMPPQAGEVSWAVCDPYLDRAGARRLRRRYQKLHQDPATVFTPHRTIAAQLRDVLQGDPKNDLVQRLPSLLERLKLNPVLLTRRIGEVSGGEAQRLALARLLLIDPALIVADEPTSRLDPIVQQQTMRLLRDIVVQDGLALILISHQRDVIKAVAGTATKARTDNLDGPASKEFRAKIKPMLIAAYDERPHYALNAGPKAAQPGAVYAVTHIDIIPPKTDEGVGSVKALADKGRAAKGSVRYDALTQANRPNHMTLAESWTNTASQSSDTPHCICATSANNSCR